jgi:hypothetical protein
MKAHPESECIYFGDVSTAIFWLTSVIGTIRAIVTGFKAIDMLRDPK